MPAMTPEPPAGYFSTFSILDPNGTSAEGPVRTQKRNRRVFVCIPCHKRKLKCDKNLPCSRCVSSGAAHDCIYQAFPSASRSESGTLSRERTRTPPSSNVDGPDRCMAEYRARDAKALVSGPTHWANIAGTFEEACPYIFDRDPQWEPRYRQIKSLKYLFNSMSGTNFPFTSSLSAKSIRILDILPTRHIVEALVANYLETFEITHRLLHPMQFSDEMEALWKSPELISDGWLAQLCMMLALGCETAPEYLFEGTGRSRVAWTDLFLESAEMYFGRSPFMLSPNLTTLRTLCMMVLVKLSELRPCGSDQLATFMGFVTRMAVSLSVNRTTRVFVGMPKFEAEMRRRLWVTIQILDLDVAMRSGTSNICIEHDTDSPANANEVDYHRLSGGGWAVDGMLLRSSQEHTDATFQIRAAEIVPILSEAINAVNSPIQPNPEYEKVLSWDSRLRRRLREAEAVLTLSPYNCAKRSNRALLQYQFLEILVHRTLLALHHTFAKSLQSKRYEQSRLVIMESSLALLDIQQSWASPASRCPSTASENSFDASTGSSPTLAVGEPAMAPTWLMDVCHDDFASGIMYALTAFRRQDFEDTVNEGIPPTHLACAAVQQATLYLRDRACRSIPHFKEFTGVSILCTTMRVIRTSEPLLLKMMELANDIEQLVVASKQNIIWTGTGDSLNFSSTGGSSLSQPIDPYMTLDTSELLVSFT